MNNKVYLLVTRLEQTEAELQQSDPYQTSYKLILRFIIQLNNSTNACAAYTHITITRSVKNAWAQASKKYAVQFQLMFVHKSDYNHYVHFSQTAESEPITSLQPFRIRVQATNFDQTALSRPNYSN